MIPKIIHYIWLSGERIPPDTQYYMASWKKYLPDYQIKCWDQTSFDITSVPFVKEAVEAKKWAFAADYIRLYALYTEGGIYLDSDILLLKPVIQLIKNCDFFSAIECFFPRKARIAIQAAFMASIPQHSFLLDCMNWYKDKHFIHNVTYNNDFVAPDVYALCAEKYGFVYKNIEQRLEKNILLVPSSIIASSYKSAKKDVYAIHCCSASWRDRKIFNRLKRVIKLILNILKR
jgi:mannosyltransferase OCH1-like enzyme